MAAVGFLRADAGRPGAAGDRRGAAFFPWPTGTSATGSRPRGAGKARMPSGPAGLRVGDDKAAVPSLSLVIDGGAGRLRSSSRQCSSFVFAVPAIWFATADSPEENAPGGGRLKRRSSRGAGNRNRRGAGGGAGLRGLVGNYRFLADGDLTTSAVLATFAGVVHLAAQVPPGVRGFENGTERSSSPSLSLPLLIPVPSWRRLSVRPHRPPPRCSAR